MAEVKRSENNKGGKEMRSQNDSLKFNENLNDQEKKMKAKDVLKRLKHNKVSIFLPFKGLDNKHKVIFLLAIVCSIASGAGFPLFNVYFGEILKGIIEGTNINDLLLIYLWIAIAQFCFSFISFFCIELVSKHVTNNLKLKFLRSVFYLDGEFHDENPGAKLNSDLEFYLTKIRSGISVKFIMIFTYFTTFMMLFGWSLYESYRLTLCIALVFPLIFIVSRICHKYARKYQTKSLLYSNNSLSIAEEAFVGIRTVAAYCGEKLMLEKYQKSEKYYSKYILKANLFESLNTGFINLFVLSGYALGFWYGTKMILDQLEASMGNFDPDAFDGASVLSILIGILVAMFMLTIMLPALNDYVAAVDSTHRLYEIINRESKIKNDEANGKKLKSVDKIQFRNVKFRYTMRNDVEVYRSLNFELKKGQVYAFVGESGCGKSTILKLIERLYDPTEGDIIINDGYSLKDLNVKWWRSQIGIVSQEPRLFSRSIASNIKFSLISKWELDRLGEADGSSGLKSNMKSKKSKIGQEENTVPAKNNDTKNQVLGTYPDIVSNTEVRNVGKKIFIHDFISTLPHKYNTVVGSNATDLSGGQKQRISIARAIIRNPHILILDEATSSLDNKSEHMVQKTINKLEGSESRITIIVAHRLSTIRYANKIFVLSNKQQLGEENNMGSYIAESGTHEELLQHKNGLYYNMLKNQKVSNGNKYENASKLKDEYGNSPDSSFDKLSKFNDSSSPDSGILNEKEKIRALEENNKKSSKWSFSCKSLFKSKCCKKKTKQDFSYIYKEIFKNKKYVALAMLFILISGTLYPFFGLVFARFIRILFDVANAKKNSERFAIYIVLISIGMCIGETLQNYFKCIIGENVEKETKKKLMENIIHQEISFFEKEDHAPGILLSHLSRDIHLLKVGFVNNLGVVIYFVVMSLVSGIMSFYYCPIIAIYLTLLYSGLSRLIAIKQSYQNTDDVGGPYSKQMINASEDQIIENVDFLIQDAFLNMDVIINYGLENYYLSLIKLSLEKSYHKEKGHHVKRSVLWGLSQCAQLIAHASTYWISSKLLSNMHVNVDDLFDSIFVFLITGNYAGKLLANKGSAIEAEESFEKYYPLILKKSAIDSRNEDGIRIDKNKAKGIVELKKINFRYPSRPAIPVYNNLSFTCDEKKTTAIVGETGCGKSTIMGLLLKYYDLKDEHVIDSMGNSPEDMTSVGNTESDIENAHKNASLQKLKMKEKYSLYKNEGEILIDGININDYNLRDMRGLFSIVTQEPMLFNMSIFENVAFGVSGATIEDVKRVCKIAAVDQFIESLPEKYDTNVGPFGKNLSGGQKQRVTLARALLKNPHILLLDEATSSLDSNSEKLIEEAFERIKSKRDTTIITIAHRISSIKRSDKIVVLNNPDKLGSSVQAQGTHNELLAMKDSIYTKYVNLAS